MGVYYLIPKYLLTMKFIITESQFSKVIKKFDKERQDRGKIGLAIEELVLQFFEGPICDVIAVKIPRTGDYVVLILTPNYYGDIAQTKIRNTIEKFIGVDAMVLINHSPNCDKTEE